MDNLQVNTFGLQYSTLALKTFPPFPTHLYYFYLNQYTAQV